MQQHALNTFRTVCLVPVEQKLWLVQQLWPLRTKMKNSDAPTWRSALQTRSRFGTGLKAAVLMKLGNNGWNIRARCLAAAIR